jgi:hypothetical protein
LDLNLSPLLNQTDGGDGPNGVIFSEKRKKYLSDMLKGRKQTLEHIQQQQESRKKGKGWKNKQSKESHEKQAKSLKLYWDNLTKEERELRCKILKEIWAHYSKDDLRRQQIKNLNLGKHFSDERKQNMRRGQQLRFQKEREKKNLPS